MRSALTIEEAAPYDQPQVAMISAVTSWMISTWRAPGWTPASYILITLPMGVPENPTHT